MSDRTFQATRGLKFMRREGGSVAVLAGEGPPHEGGVMDADTWASVVACMSYSNETAETFRWARNLHLRGNPELAYSKVGEDVDTPKETA